jgi:hypothetical protein
MGKGLRNLFKSKPGGTFFGNALRGVAGIASGLNVPGAGFVSSLLPAAPAPVMEKAFQLVSQAMQAPASSASESKLLATAAKEEAFQAGASSDDASRIGAAVYTASSLPAAQAVAVLDSAAPALANSFTAKDAKNVLNKALEGLLNGTADGVMDTKEGKAMTKAAVNAKGEEIMPWVLGGLAGVFGILLYFQKKR